MFDLLLFVHGIGKSGRRLAISDKRGIKRLPAKYAKVAKGGTSWASEWGKLVLPASVSKRKRTVAKIEWVTLEADEW